MRISTGAGAGSAEAGTGFCVAHAFLEACRAVVLRGS